MLFHSLLFSVAQKKIKEKSWSAPVRLFCPFRFGHFYLMPLCNLPQVRDFK